MYDLKIIHMISNFKERLTEIDGIRGIALFFMIIYHLFFDLYNLDNFSFQFVNGPFFSLLGDWIGGMFLLLVGISLHLSISKAGKKLSYEKLVSKYLFRGIKIFSWGILLSILSFLLIGPTNYIQFGALHLIGVSIILMIPFLFMRRFHLPISIFFIVIGIFLNQITCSERFIALGCTPETFSSIDYFPLFPWFGVVLFGFWLGQKLIPKPEKEPIVKTNNIFIQFITISGRHSLGIYLLHQPIIWILLTFLYPLF